MCAIGLCNEAKHYLSVHMNTVLFQFQTTRNICLHKSNESNSTLSTALHSSAKGVSTRLLAHNDLNTQI